MKSDQTMSCDTLNTCINDEMCLAELTQSARGLAYKWFRLFDSLAEDVDHAATMLLNEAYIEAASHSEPQYQSLRSWFVGTMRHILMRKQRSLKREQWQLMTSSTFSPDEDLPEEYLLESNLLDTFLSLCDADPEYLYLAREQREYVDWLLSFLNTQDHRIVDLYFFRCYRGPEIAQMYHWSLPYFHTHLHSILKRLRAIAHERSKDEEWNAMILPGNRSEHEKSCCFAF